MSIALPATNVRFHATPRTINTSSNARAGYLPAASRSAAYEYVMNAHARYNAHPAEATASAPKRRTASPAPNKPGANIAIRWYCSAVALRSNECPPSSPPVMASGAALITRNIAVHATATHDAPLRASRERRKMARSEREAE